MPNSSTRTLRKPPLGLEMIRNHPHSLIGHFLQLIFNFAVATNRCLSIFPGTGWRRGIVLATEPFPSPMSLLVVGCHQLGEVVIVDVPAMKFFRGRPLERVGR